MAASPITGVDDGRVTCTVDGVTNVSVCLYSSLGVTSIDDSEMGETQYYKMSLPLSLSLVV